jgi:hypothetical protein
MGRYNITMPEDLWRRVGEAAPAGNRSFFIRRALEAALGGSSRGGESRSGESGVEARHTSVTPGAGSTPARPASPRASEPEEKAETSLPKVARRHWA